MLVTVALKQWRSQILCRAVSLDQETGKLLLALPEDLDWEPQAEEGTQLRIGWPDHGGWHVSLATLTATIPSNASFLRLIVDGTPVHHERRRHVRVLFNRPVTVSTKNNVVQGTTVSASESAIRIILPLSSPTYDGAPLNLVLQVPHRRTGDLQATSFEGRVFRSRELTGRQAGMKEIVVMYDTTTDVQADHIRGLIYELEMLEKARRE
jgi:hypothetical protein